MLEDLIKGHEKSQYVLITDSTDSCGRTLLLNWIESLASRLNSVILVCFERRPEYFKSWLSQGLQNRVIFIDGSSKINNSSECAKDLFALLCPELKKVKGQTAVVMDSLSLHVLTHSTPAVCTALHKIYSEPCVLQTVAVFHRDVHDSNTCCLLEHMAKSVVALSQTNLRQKVCHIRHCRPTGKVFRTVESYTTDENFRVQNIKPIPTSSEIDIPSSATTEPDPMSSLSFNLSLTDKEKEDRSQVVLPHTLVASGDADNSQSDSRIHYIPDDDDDLDEEDPDDDLNF